MAKWISTAIFQFNFSSSMEIRGFFLFPERKKKKSGNSTIILIKEGNIYKWSGCNEMVVVRVMRDFFFSLDYPTVFHFIDNIGGVISSSKTRWNLFKFSKYYYFRFDDIDSSFSLSDTRGFFLSLNFNITRYFSSCVTSVQRYNNGSNSKEGKDIVRNYRWNSKLRTTREGGKGRRRSRARV